MQERRATNAARTGRRRPKGEATKAAQDACAPEMLLHYEVEVTAPALTDRQLCQTKEALPDLGTKDPAHSEGGVANIWRQLCQGDHRVATPLFEDARGLRGFGALDCGNGDLVCQSPGLVTRRPPAALVPC